jgi:hypothetical protein
MEGDMNEKPDAGPKQDAFMQVLASLVAAVSLLKNSGKAAKKAAPSDKMFDQMILDYEKAIEQGRDALAQSDAEQHDVRKALYYIKNALAPYMEDKLGAAIKTVEAALAQSDASDASGSTTMSKDSDEGLTDFQVRLMQELSGGTMLITASELANPEIKELFRLGYVQKVDGNGPWKLWGLTQAGMTYLKDWT